MNVRDRFSFDDEWSDCYTHVKPQRPLIQQQPLLQQQTQSQQPQQNTEKQLRQDKNEYLMTQLLQLLLKKEYDKDKTMQDLSQKETELNQKELELNRKEVELNQRKITATAVASAAASVAAGTSSVENSLSKNTLLEEDSSLRETTPLKDRAGNHFFNYCEDYECGKTRKNIIRLLCIVSILVILLACCYSF